MSGFSIRPFESKSEGFILPIYTFNKQTRRDLCRKGRDVIFSVAGAAIAVFSNIECGNTESMTG